MWLRRVNSYRYLPSKLASSQLYMALNFIYYITINLNAYIMAGAIMDFVESQLARKTK